MDANDFSAKPTDIAAGAPPPSGPKPAPAFCPKCNGAMGLMDAACLHCGYEFPARLPRGYRPPAFTLFADIVLVIAAVIAGLGFVGLTIAAFMTFVGGEVGAALILEAGAIVSLALVIVFMRVQRLEPPP